MAINPSAPNSYLPTGRQGNFLYNTLLVAVIMLLVGNCSSSRETVQGENGADKGIEQQSVLESMNYDSAISQKKQPDAAPEKDFFNGTVNIERLLSQMTLREKIGQLFFVGANGYFRSEDSDTYQELLRQVQEHHIGGIIFFSGNVYGQAVLTNKLQEHSKIPLWITQDMEYGAAMRVDGATRFVPAMGVAATQNPKYAYWQGKVTAHEAKSLGVNQIFAPVLDVNNNPENPVINVRSFSGDPATVTQFGQEFIRGVESEGLIATAKHFPGHGDTDTDSHIALPTINHNYTRLDTLELVPFRSAINNGLQSVMSAHISFPKISENPQIPGTLDETVLNRILIDSLNFQGMVVTDGLEMNGIASNFSPGNAVVRALKAGADLMLLSPDISTAINEIEKALQQDVITEQRIDQSVRKLLAWKKHHGLFDKKNVDIPGLSSQINIKEHRLIANEISRKSLTLVKNEGELLPIRAEKFPKVMVLSIADDKSGETGTSFAEGIKDYHPDVRFHVLDKRTGIEERKEILRDARESDLIVLGSFIYVRSGQEVQISREQMQLLQDLPDKPSVLVAFGNPYVVSDLPSSDAQLMAWSASRNQVQAAVPALFGGSRISGRLPIEIPGMYEMEHGIELPQSALRYDEPETVGFAGNALKEIDTIMNQAVFDSTFPGGVVTVVKDGVIAYQKAFGYHTYDKLEKVSSTDIYDLASLTKVMATTTSIMKLVDEEKIKLSDKVSTYIPEFRKGKKQQITIRNLLLHNSGLPPFRIYVDSLQTEAEIIQTIKNEPLINAPGNEYVYSDLGFILLGEIVEIVTGTPLDRYVRQKFFYPLGMNSTHFNPKDKGPWHSDRIPPTEIDTVYRQKKIQAEAHDERAWYMNGVAGHAGLFSSANDLAVYAQMLMSKGTYAGRRYLQAETVASFTKRQSELSGRGYGFDHKSLDGFSSAGSLASASTFGHTGFTGTSMWIDPERNTAIIMLTNRTYPYRSYGSNISRVRAAVADAVISAIED